MLLGVKDDKVVTVAGDPAHPVNRGRLCPKGLSEHHILDAPGRLTTPTVDGAPVSWDAALDKVVGHFQRILHDHGPDSVAILSTGPPVTDEVYAPRTSARTARGLAPP